MGFKGKISAGLALILMLNIGSAFAMTYTVKKGDNLYNISKKYKVSVQSIKSASKIKSDKLKIGQKLTIPVPSKTASKAPAAVKKPAAAKPAVYTVSSNTTYVVKKGDSLYTIAKKYGTTIDAIKKASNLKSNSLKVGQKLTVPVKKIVTKAPAVAKPVVTKPSANAAASQMTYTVQSGDSLYLISKRYGTSIAELKQANKLTSDMIYVGQKLVIPAKQPSTGNNVQEVKTPSALAANVDRPGLGNSWSSIVSYIVKPGDTATGVAKKFNMSAQDIMKYNFMKSTDWLDAGDRIAISNYAPRQYAVTPGEAKAPARVGKLVDWDLDGQYILKRNDIFTITDKATGKSFKVKMLGGYNHSDVEPLTSADTTVMKQLFSTWTWTPRPVVVFKDGMNIAASLSGQPHSFDTTPSNGVTGHFDLYLLNSKPHSGETSQTYVSQHRANVITASK